MRALLMTLSAVALVVPLADATSPFRNVAVPFWGHIFIDGSSTSPAPIVTPSPGMSCSSVTWNAGTASVSCSPIAPPAPGTYWACVGPAAVVLVHGFMMTTAAIDCPNAPSTSCTATSASTSLIPATFCVSNPNPTSIGNFNMTCSATPHYSREGPGDWRVNCEFPDP